MADAWNNAQKMELDHWRSRIADPVTSRDAVFEASCCAYTIWTRLGVSLADGIGATMIDIGCGPTNRMACFAGAKIIGIDPLGDEYYRLAPALMDLYAELWYVKAEEFITSLDGTADLVACINCLDHCDDPRKVLENMLRYCKPGGRGVLSVDCSEQTEEMHPSRMIPQRIDKLLSEVGWRIERSDSGDAYPHFNITGEVDGWDAGWSPGVVAYHWMLRRP